MENNGDFCEFQRKSPLNLDTCSTKNWRSETKDSFFPIENSQQEIGNFLFYFACIHFFNNNFF